MRGNYARFHYGSCFRGGFTAEQRVLLDERAVVWNKLVDAANTHILQLRSQFEHINPDLVTIREQYQMKPSITTRRNWRSAIGAFRSEILAADKDLNRSITKILGESGIWWPNRDGLYDSFTRALRTNKSELRPIQYAVLNHHHGNFAFRFHKGATFEELESGKLPVRVQRDGIHAVIEMPIHADSFGKYRYGRWQFTLHRDLPSNCSIRGINVIGKLVGAEWRLGISFLISTPPYISPVHGDPIRCGIDVGWRMSPYGLRVATAAIDGRFEDLYLPLDWTAGMNYIEQLDVRLNTAGETAWKASEMPGEYPGWRRMEAIASRVASGPCHEWLLTTKSLRRERKNKRARLERVRLDIYRKYSARIARECDVIQIEKLNLLKLLDPELGQIPELRRQQRRAATSILHQCLEHAASRYGKTLNHIESYRTTTKHLDCGFINLPSNFQMITCKGCGSVYDQDSNAALNIAAAPPA